MARGKSTLENEVKTRLDGQTFLTHLEENTGQQPFPWQVLSTRELAELFHVHLQTLHNWHVRGRGPEPEPKGKWKGNRRYFTVASVVAWLDDRPTWHVYRDWYKDKFHNVPKLSKEELQARINDVISVNAYPQTWKRNRRFPAGITLGEAS